MNRLQKILFILLSASVLFLGVWVYVEHTARNDRGRQENVPTVQRHSAATSDQRAEARKWIAWAQSEAGGASGDAKRTVSSEIAKAQAEVGDVEDALRTAQQMTNDQAKVGCLLAIIAAQIKSGDVPGSRKTAALVLKMAQDSAGSDTPGLPGLPRAASSDSDYSLAQMVRVQATAGDVDGARQSVESVKSNPQKVFALDQIAIAQFKTGDLEASRQTLSTALHIAESEPKEARDELLRNIATTKATMRDSAGGLQVAMTINDPEIKSLALNELASQQAEDGDEKSSRETFGEAIRYYSIMTSADGLPVDMHKATFFHFLKPAQIKAGEGSAAIKAAQSIDDKFMLCLVLCDIARVQVDAGDIAASKDCLTLAVEAASSQDELMRYGRNRAASVIAGAQAKAGDIAGAFLTVSTFATEKNAKLEAQCEIAAAQARAGDVAGAVHTQQSVTDYTPNTANTLCAIAEAQARSGDTNAARASIMSLAPGQNRCGGYLAVAYTFLVNPTKPFEPVLEKERSESKAGSQSTPPTVTETRKLHIQPRTLAGWKLYFVKDAKISSMIGDYGKPDTIDTGDNKTVYLWYRGLDYGANESGILRVRVSPYRNELIVVSIYDGYNELTVMMPWANKVLGSGDFGMPDPEVERNKPVADSGPALSDGYGEERLRGGITSYRMQDDGVSGHTVRQGLGATLVEARNDALRHAREDMGSTKYVIVSESAMANPGSYRGYAYFVRISYDPRN